MAAGNPFPLLIHVGAVSKPHVVPLFILFCSHRVRYSVYRADAVVLNAEGLVLLARGGDAPHGTGPRCGKVDAAQRRRDAQQQRPGPQDRRGETRTIALLHFRYAATVGAESHNTTGWGGEGWH